MVPKKLFLTKGVGVHKDKLASFELALRNAGIEKCNLVYVSSILPPNCKIVSKEEGLKLLNPGQITFCVMARLETNEPHRDYRINQRLLHEDRKEDRNIDHH